jgi:hypothetical protein
MGVRPLSRIEFMLWVQGVTVMHPEPQLGLWKLYSLDSSLGLVVVHTFGSHPFCLNAIIGLQLAVMHKHILCSG